MAQAKKIRPGKIDLDAAVKRAGANHEKGLQAFLNGAPSHEESPPAIFASNGEASSAFRHIPLDMLDENPINARILYHQEDLLRLGTDMQREGLKKPILAVETTNGRYLVIDGHRRWKAAGLVGWSSIEAKIDDRIDVSNLAQLYGASFRLNDLNEPMRDIEKAIRWSELIKSHGFSLERVSEITGCGVSSISEIVSIADLPPNILDFVKENPDKLSSSLLREVRAVFKSRDEAAAMELISTIVRQDLSVREVRKIASNARKPRQRTPRLVSIPVKRGKYNLGQVKVFSDGSLTVDLRGLDTLDLQEAGQRIANAIISVLNESKE